MLQGTTFAVFAALGRGIQRTSQARSILVQFAAVFLFGVVADGIMAAGLARTAVTAAARTATIAVRAAVIRTVILTRNFPVLAAGVSPAILVFAATSILS